MNGEVGKKHHFNRDIILQRRSPKHTSYHFYTPICGDGTRTTFLNTLVLVYVQYMFRAWFILFMGYHYTTSDFPSLGTHMMTTIQWGEFFKHRIIKMALSKQMIDPLFHKMMGFTPYILGKISSFRYPLEVKYANRCVVFSFLPWLCMFV